MTSLEDKARGKGGRTVAAIKVVVQQSRNNSRFNDILSVMYCTKGQFQGDPTIHICYMSPGLLSSELWAWCVDAVLRLLGVFHDVLYGDVKSSGPVPGKFL